MSENAPRLSVNGQTPRGKCRMPPLSGHDSMREPSRRLHIMRHRRFQPTLVRPGQYDEAIAYLDAEIAECMRCEDAE